jgi:hypothetical protein
MSCARSNIRYRLISRFSPVNLRTASLMPLASTNCIIIDA